MHFANVQTPSHTLRPRLTFEPMYFFFLCVCIVVVVAVALAFNDPDISER